MDEQSEATQENGPQQELPRSLADLADWLLNWKEAKSVAEDAVKKANEKVRELEQLVYAKMQEDQIEKFGHAGMLFFPTVNSFPSVVKEHEEAFFAWLKENGEDGICKYTVHPMTLRSWYKNNSDRFAEELAEKELVKVHEEIRIGVRKQ
jgi:hypothetical protein